MNSIIQKIFDLKFLPIIGFDSLKNPAAFVSILLEQNVTVLQLNVKKHNIDQHSQEIQELIKQFPEMYFGAGFLYDENSAEKVLKMGFQFLVSDVLAENILPISKKYNAEVILSGLSPTEIYRANQLTPEIVQIFPAAQISIRSVISLIEHMPNINLMMTGGLNLSAVLELLSCGVKAVGVKGAIFQKQYLQTEHYLEISNSVKNFKERLQKIT